MFGLPRKAAQGGDLFLVAAGSAKPGSKAAAARRRAIASQALPVVHMLASSLRVDRSLPTAVRHAARHLEGPAAEELLRLEWAVRIRHFASIDEGFLALADAVGESDGELKRALLTLHGAEAESTREGLERRLDRAYDIVVRAEERRRGKLASTLERPTHLLFGLAVVLPLVLASLLPMLQFGGGGMGPAPAALLLVVAVPLLTLLGASRVLDSNFLGAQVAAQGEGRAFRAALAAPVAGAAAFVIHGALPALGPLPLAPFLAAACGASGLGAGAFLLRSASRREAAQSGLDRGLPDLLHSVGTKMVAGRSAEFALLETVEASKDSPLALKLRGVLFDVIVGRRSLDEAVERDEEIRGAPRVFPAFRLLASAAARDSEAAGRVVLHLAEFERLRAEAGEALRSKVRAVVDTTRTTVTVFAPLILGITSGMFGLLSRVGTGFVPGATAAPALGAEAFSAIVLLYLCLEVALADWFAARLLSDAPLTAFGKWMARDVPLAPGRVAAAAVGSGALF